MAKKEARRSRKETTAAPAPENSALLRRAGEWLDRSPRLVFAILVLVATARIVSTYTVFNHTVDEPAHVACGLEWLQKGTYHLEPQHPPLARIATAIGPYLMGRRLFGVPNIFQEGALILYGDNHYDRNLALARLGVLPFFWIASLVVFWWGRRYFGNRTAALALFFFTFLPPVLAHAGLATTDMALTAFTGASFLAGLIWLEEPTWIHAAAFGVCTGLAVLSKFSSLPFLPSAFLAALAWYWWTRRPGAAEWMAQVHTRILPFCAAVAVGCLVVWAGYRFSFGKSEITGQYMPAPAILSGIRAVILHNRTGHLSYFLGMHASHGWWYYYPVVLAVKTPIVLLALYVVGKLVIWKQTGVARARWGMPLMFAAGILIFALFSDINIGVRHVLPAYIGFSLVAAIGAMRLMEMAATVRWAGWALGIALVWMAATSLLSHPDYIPYFNFLAGSEPEKIVTDSDLDWGQDMKRLAARLHEVGAREVAFNPTIVAYLERVHGFPPIHPLDPEVPAPGWNAISLTELKVTRMGLEDREPGVQLWPEHIAPTEKLGKTIWLYYFPPGRR